MAGQVSLIDQHPKRNSIITNLLAGVPLKVLATRYGVSAMSLSRYKNKVVKPALLGGQTAESVAELPHSVAEVRQQRDVVKEVMPSQTVRSAVEKQLARFERVYRQVAPDEGEVDVQGFVGVSGAETRALSLLADLTGERAVQQATGNQVIVFLPPTQDAPRVDLADEGGMTIDQP